MRQPLVSIIVVCHNQARFVQEAINSALTQTYQNVEVLVVDDCSQDGTVEIIRGMAPFKKILLDQPRGYCAAFNTGWSASKGEYVIDLAGDDVLMPTRAEKGVAALRSSGAGVDFCDAFYIDEQSKVLGTHYRRDSNGLLRERVEDGNVFSLLLERYFICSPTMMIDGKVLDYLGGYDENLFYEDFDFWIRSSRNFSYHFTDEVLVKKRVVSNSMSKSQYQPNSKMLDSTLRVCQKALGLCRSEQEFRSLTTRLRYEMRQAVISNNYLTARGLQQLMEKVQGNSIESRLWSRLINRGWNFSFLTPLMGKAR